MSWDNLKNRLQQDSSQKEVKLDIDEIWSAIEPEVDVINQERRKKRFFFFWLVGVGVLITVGSIYLLVNNNSSNSTLVDFEKIEKTTSEEQHAHHHAEVEMKNTVENEVEESNNIKTKELNSITTNQGSSNIVISKKETKNKNQNTSPSFDWSNEEMVKDKLPWKISKSDQKSQPQKELVDSGLVFSNNKNANDNSSVGLDKKASKRELLDISNLSMLALKLPVIDISTLPTTNIANYYQALTMEEINEILSEDDDDDNPYGQPTFTFSLGLMGGIGSAPNNLTTKNDTVSSLLLIRRDTESSLETNQLGLEFSIRHKKGFHLTSGIQQTTFVEKVAFDDTVTKVTEVEGIIEIFINPAGDSIPIYGLIDETAVTTIEKKHYTRYKLLEIPLIIGWQTNDKNGTGWTFGVETGIIPNLTLKTTGRIFNENYDDVDIGANQEDYFKKNIGLSYHLGFSVRRMLTDNIELSLKPTVRFFPKDFSAAGNNISQKYNLVSGQLGVNYIFGN